MRNKKEAEALDQKARSEVVFPTWPQEESLRYFIVRLREILEKNVDYSIAKTLRYDSHTGTCYVEIHYTATPGIYCKKGDSIALKVSHTVEYNPKTESISNFIQKILAEQDRLIGLANQAQMLLDMDLSDEWKVKVDVVEKT